MTRGFALLIGLVMSAVWFVGLYALAINHPQIACVVGALVIYAMWTIYRDATDELVQ